MVLRAQQKNPLTPAYCANAVLSWNTRKGVLFVETAVIPSASMGGMELGKESRIMADAEDPRDVRG